MSTATLVQLPVPEHSAPTIRYGEEADVAAVVACHRRCSEGTLARRFHVPRPIVSDRIARSLLLPEGGWSLVAVADGRIVGLATVAPLSPYDLDLGLLVEDAYQGQGIGSALLKDMAVEGAARSYSSIQGLTQADNQALLGTVEAAGLRARRRWSGCLMHVLIPLTRMVGDLRLPA